ncbi:MAG: transposase [Actinobacteria bacterium]|nr:transposase [Actinomycetota bacterium]
MPRKLRVQFQGAFYHVMSRGTSKQPIFLCDGDCLDFLSILAEVVNRFAWVCYAYCLMGNHYHVLIETLQPSLSEGMHALNSEYCNSFNRKYGRVGHVLQGRYDSPLVKDESHLLELTRYIVLNPVRHGAARKPEEWRWSSFRSMIGLAPVPSFLEISFILGLFSDDSEKGREAYVTFVEEGLTECHLVDPKDRIPLRELFRGEKDKRQRNEAIRSAHAEHGYTLKEIAAYLQVSSSTVSRAKKQ